MTVQPEAVAALRVFDRIVCGIDGSQVARGGTAGQAPPRSARDLHLTTVVEVDTAVHAGWATSHVLAQLEQGSRQALHQAIDEIDPEQRARGRRAGPRAAEADRGDRRDAGRIEPHRRSRAVGILLGGVATTMLHEAPCSVLLARPPADPARFPTRIGVEWTDRASRSGHWQSRSPSRGDSTPTWCP